MGIDYVISNGKLYIDKKVFSKELLISSSPLRKIMGMQSKKENRKMPKINKNENIVVIDYREADDVKLDEHFEDLFKILKSKYREKVKGYITIRIGMLTPYKISLNFDSYDESIKFEF